MADAKWVNVVVAGLLAGAWAQAQEAVIVPANRNSTVLRSWQSSDGRTVYEFKDLDTGEHLTIIDGEPVNDQGSCSAPMKPTLTSPTTLPQSANAACSNEVIQPVSSATLVPVPQGSSPTPVILAAPGSSSLSSMPVIMEPEAPKKRGLFGRRRESKGMPQTIVVPSGTTTPIVMPSRTTTPMPMSPEPIIIPSGQVTPMPAPKKKSLLFWSREPKPEVIMLPASTPPPPEAIVVPASKK